MILPATALQSREHTVRSLGGFIVGPVGRTERVFLLACYAALICARLPNVFKGRLWAEEGNVFFTNAWTLPWYEALFSPHGGYWNVIANVAGLLARYLANLHSAPYITTFIALFFQLCPAILILTSREPWLERRAVLVVALLLIAMPPVSEEVWLNSLHSQFHLALCAALILSFGPTCGAVELFRRTLLLLGPLSGPGAALFAPLFLLRAILDRSRPRFMQAVTIGLGTATQVLLFYSDDPSRHHSVGVLPLLSVIFVRHVALPFSGRDQAIATATDLQTSMAQGNIGLWAPLVAIIVLCVLVAALIVRRNTDLVWLFVTGFCLAVVSYYGALGDLNILLRPDMGERYSYAPQAIFALVVLGLAATGRDLLAKAFWVVVLWLLIVDGREYFSVSEDIARGPDWHAEVKAWHKDRARPLAIWPTGWKIHLPSEAQ